MLFHPYIDLTIVCFSLSFTWIGYMMHMCFFEFLSCQIAKQNAKNEAIFRRSISSEMWIASSPTCNAKNQAISAILDITPQEYRVTNRSINMTIHGISTCVPEPACLLKTSWCCKMDKRNFYMISHLKF